MRTTSSGELVFRTRDLVVAASRQRRCIAYDKGGPARGSDPRAVEDRPVAGRRQR